MPKSGSRLPRNLPYEKEESQIRDNHGLWWYRVARKPENERVKGN